MRQKDLALALKAIDALALACSLVFTIYLIPASIGPLTLADGNASSALRHGALPFGLLASIPLIVIAVRAWQMFSALERDESFSEANAERLRQAGVMAGAEAVLFACATMALALFGAITPGPLAVLMVVVIACSALAAVCFSLSHLMAKAANLQAENELTV